MGYPSPTVAEGALSLYSSPDTTSASSVNDYKGYAVVIDASEDGTKKVWQDEASVKTSNLTYKIWSRKF